MKKPEKTFRLGGDLSVNRLGFGAMRVTGKGVWGEPDNRAEALRTLRRLPELGVDFIDTADSYGPFVSEDLIAEALAPYKGVVVATKGGLTRHGPGIWLPVGRPEYLRQCVLMSLRRLKVEALDLWQLHRIDPKTPRAEQFGVMADMLKEGLIRHAGLSNVTVEDIEAARKVFPRRHGAEPLQLGRPLQRRRAELLRGQRHRLHPLVPACRGQPGPAGDRARRHRAHDRRNAQPGRTGLGA